MVSLLNQEVTRCLHHQSPLDIRCFLHQMLPSSVYPSSHPNWSDHLMTSVVSSWTSDDTSWQQVMPFLHQMSPYIRPLVSDGIIQQSSLASASDSFIRAWYQIAYIFWCHAYAFHMHFICIFMDHFYGPCPSLTLHIYYNITNDTSFEINCIFYINLL